MTRRELVATILIVLVCVLGLGACTLRCSRGIDPTYSNGERSGELYKLSRKGIWWKSWEGSLRLSQTMRRSTDGVITPDTWEFSVTDPAIAEQLQEVQHSGGRVTLHYQQWLLSPITQESDSTVYKVIRD